MSEWKDYLISEVFDNFGGTALEKEFIPNSKYKVISIGSYGLNSNYIDQGLRADGTGKSKSKILNKNDLVMVLNDKTSEGKIIGRTLLIEESDAYVYNQRSERLVPKFGDSKFYWYLLNSTLFRKKVIKAKQGSTQIYINFSTVKNFKVTLPPLKEQKKITEILSSLDEQIEKTEQLIEKTKELKKGLMRQLLTKGIDHTEFMQTELGEIPIEWEIVKQGNVATFFNGRAYKQTEFTESGTQIIRIQNLTGGKNYVYSDMELDANKYVEKDDLIYAWSATFGPYIWKGPKSIYHYHIWKIEVNENLLDKYFFFYRLDYISVEMHSQKNGSAFAHLTKGGMENHAIPLPPLNEQKKIADILLSVDEQIKCYEKEKEKQLELKKALMQQLLTGKLRVMV